MKQVRSRAKIILILSLCFLIGVGSFLFLWVRNGGEWVNFFGHTSLYSQGVIYDRGGALLYDGEAGTYNESKNVRKATMHLVGNANIATSMRTMLSDRLSGYHLLTGTAFGSQDIYLTVDAELSRTAYEALNGQKGVVAVYNYQTGDVLCAVSSPTYDPQNPPEDTSGSEYEGVFLNRFFSNTFPPGSIFKVVTAAAYIENRPAWRDFRYSCGGSLNVEGQTITCPYAHGENQDLYTAFANSCNGAFGQIALDLGGTVLEDYMKKAGLLDSHDIMGIDTARGQVTPAEAGSVNLAWSGSGQFHNLVNPASFLMLMGGVANGGSAKIPNFLDKQTFSNTKLPSTLGERSGNISIFEPTTCAILQEMMRNNVAVTYGQENFASLSLGAKSGTAEVGGGKQPHAWFAGFLQDSQYPLAFVVLVENGGGGSAVAGRIASKVLQAAVLP